MVRAQAKIGTQFYAKKGPFPFESEFMALGNETQE